MRKSFNGRIKLKKANLKESSEKLHNPGCGWYHVYYFSVPGSEEESSKETVEESVFLYEEETLVLALVNIGRFQASEISACGLSYITHILDFLRKNGKQVILRFSYDTTGHGLEREPASVNLVKRHMEQLQPLIAACADDILVIQGIFVGSWGEMHGSKFLTERYLRELAGTFYQVTEGSCYLAVRTPAQWRTIMGSTEREGIPLNRLALFNDGIFGSLTDMGTYGEQGRRQAGETGKWSREEELAWQEAYLGRVPNGGEILLGDQPIGYIQAAEDLKRMHLSYLNSAYQQEQLTYWKQENVERADCWGGLSGYEYIGRHLGYRFVVRDIKALSGNRLEIAIENCGFASLYEKAECFLVIEEDAGQIYRISMEADAREWKSGQKAALQAVIPHPEEIAGSGKLFLELKRKRDGRSLYFANQGAGEKVLLAGF